MKPFLEKHSDEWYELWKTPKGALTRRDFPTFYREVVDVMGMQGMLFGFLAAWWPLRRNKNVLLVHFADMKRDHEGSIRRIAEFIGIAPSPEEWARILEYTSFPWMKTHAVKFDGVKIADVPLLVPGAMVRKGEVGTAREDGMTPEIAGHLREVGRRLCPDDEAIAWLYEGGPVPGVEQ